MKKLLSILFLAASMSTNAENTNLISQTNTNYPNVKIDTNNNWRIEAEKYPLRYCSDIRIKENGVRYSADR